MTPDQLEQALRDTLSRQAARSTHPADVAGTAIRRGRLGRRRRTLTGVATAALATALASAGVFSLGAPAGVGPHVVVVGDPPTGADRPAPDENPVPASPTAAEMSASPVSPAVATPPTGPPRVELVVGRRLVTTDGKRIELPAEEPVTAVRRTEGGWLVATTQPGGRSGLWYVTRVDPAHRILADLDRVVVAPDGQRVAWRIGGSIFAGTLARGKFLTTIHIAAPAGVDPVSFAGAAVLLRHGRSGHDLWWPATGEYGPAAKTGPVAAYGTLPGGHTLVTAVTTPGQPRPCLALVDSGPDLAALATSCVVPVGAPLGSISPDGRWLLTNADPPGLPADQRGTTALLVDLATLGGTVRATSAGPPLATEPVWTDAGTAVHLTGTGELVRVVAQTVAEGGEAERFPADRNDAGHKPLLVTGPA